MNRIQASRCPTSGTPTHRRHTSKRPQTNLSTNTDTSSNQRREITHDLLDGAVRSGTQINLNSSSLSSSLRSSRSPSSTLEVFKRLLFLSFIFYFILFLCSNNFIARTLAQDDANDDLTFPYKGKPQAGGQVASDPLFSATKATTKSHHRTTRPPVSRTTRTSQTTKQATQRTTTKATSPNLGIGSFLHIPQASTAAPFIYSPERLNQSHAKMFKDWLNVKSVELYQLSMNYSGFVLLNATYNYHLRKDASFAWINFTSMIMEISHTISEVLYNKTLVVKALTELVEKAYDDFRNDTERLKESINYLYYDAKSPKTFCDVAETKNQLKRNMTSAKEDTTATIPSTPPTKPSKSKAPAVNQTEEPPTATKTPPLPDETEEIVLGSTDESSSISKRSALDALVSDRFDKRGTGDKAHFNYRAREDEEFELDDENLDLLDFQYLTKKQKHPTTNYNLDFFFSSLNVTNRHHDANCPLKEHHHGANHRHHNVHLKREHVKRNEKTTGATTLKPKGGKPGAGKGKGPGGKPGGKGTKSPVTKVTKTTTTTTSPTSYYDYFDERTDLDTYDEYLYEGYDIELGDKSPYWNVSCINRTFDENFKNFQKGVNRNQSTVHVPTNVYKQDILINMTAYWTEALNEQFRRNYDDDNELFWQYFCSSDGLFRRYPGALWTVPRREDFFDCRLQSWYITAASSPKDVLILLDTSGSMTGLRLEIAKKLIESIMDTLTDNDFFNIFTFSNTVQYLMNLQNETQYQNRFIQAGKTNKLRFIEKLKYFKSTSNIAKFTEALEYSFQFLFSNISSYDSCECNKVIMIITDGSSENGEEVFKKYNWDNGRKVRVFTFLIGRDMTDPRQVEWMACANDGKSFHVATLADVNEHVHEYIPVLSRPMALEGVHETTWSNVFIGHLDKELKIAVARPAFLTKQVLLSKHGFLEEPKRMKRKKIKGYQTTTIRTTTVEPAGEYQDQGDYAGGEEQSDYNEENQEETDYAGYQEDTSEGEGAKPAEGEPSGVPSEGEGEAQNKPGAEEVSETDEEEDEDYEEFETRKKIYQTLKKQQVLLGVVGVDVPVLRLISKVSPKYQMGVGIYIIMLDNNGFIVFHPSIRREITKGEFDYKGSSHSIDLDKFEIPIDNDDDFEELEHEMIDQKTGNRTLDNWKREGLRVIRRRTEYVFTPVNNSPFSVAIASPSSFGRFYIDLPRHKAKDFENLINETLKKAMRFDTNIQLYNCTYTYHKLAERVLKNQTSHDYCIRYLFSDPDQVLAIKSDLVLHEMYYNIFNFSIFTIHKNLVKSSFYGTYSGITFYLPVTFYKNYGQTMTTPPTTTTKAGNPKASSTSSSTTTTPIPTTYTTTEWPEDTGPPSEMTINVELGSISEPFMPASTKPSFLYPSAGQKGPLVDNETEILAQNLFSTESNKHTYSFEKQYYTRAFDFSDYLRTEFNWTEPFVIYFLNETSKDARRDTVSATLPIWLDKVPTAVSGVVYDSKLLQQFLFENFMVPNCVSGFCRNLCSSKRGLNVTCYLLDEHGIVVLSTVERMMGHRREQVVGQPLYKINPWLMKRLELDGLYNLVIPGPKLQECRQPPRIRSSGNILTSILSLMFKLIGYFLYSLVQLIGTCVFSLLTSFFGGTTHWNIYSDFLSDDHGYHYLGNYFASASAPREKNLTERIDLFNYEYRTKNSHCYYFGIYSFNITMWKSLDASEMRVWCNSSQSPKHFFVGYFEHSNLLMLVVEDEFELIYCGNMTSMMRNQSGQLDEFSENSPTNLTDLALSNLSNTSSAVSQLYTRAANLGGSFIENGFFNESFMDVNGSNYTSSIANTRRDYTINRYRKKPKYCHNIFANESQYLSCNNAGSNSRFKFELKLWMFILVSINLFV